MNPSGAGNSTSNSNEHAERFTLLRPLLFTIAYEILGTATESDDVLQESYLRWAEVNLETVRDTKAFLAQLVTRQALNALRAQSRRREEYVGPWLPEPLLLTADSIGDARDPSMDVVLAESVSMAMLVVLETLTPDERAVFVLREVFGFSHDEIAVAIDKSASAVRQMAHRAREHVQSRRKRFEPVDLDESNRVTEEFLTAAATGDMDGLLALLAPDAVYTADSGGKASAARRPVVGAQKVAAMLVGLFRAGERVPGLAFERITCNGEPAVMIRSDAGMEGVFTIEVIDGKITHFYAMRNPDKLTGVDSPRVITR
jgi:RNA polymerase sigma-70 factor, ECF subfamily